MIRRRTHRNERLESLRKGVIVGEYVKVAFDVVGTGEVEVASGLLYCNGAAVSRTKYKRLFDRIGTAYGAGDGSTTFNLPDYRGRLMCYDPDGQVGSSRLAISRGAVSGVETHALSATEMAAHIHDRGSLSVPEGGSHSHGPGSLYVRAGNAADSPNSGTTGMSGGHSSGSQEGNVAVGGSTNSSSHSHPNGEWSGSTENGSADGLTGTAHENKPPTQGIGAVLVAA